MKLLLSSVVPVTRDIWWTEQTPRPLCKKDCNFMVGNKHMCVAQDAKATSESDQTGPQRRFKQSELYTLPTELIQDIFSYMV